jgi:hypothetical protein
MQTMTAEKLYEGITRDVTVGTATTQRFNRYTITATANGEEINTFSVAGFDARIAAECVWRSLPVTARETSAVTLTVRHPRTGELIVEICKLRKLS